MSSLKPRKWSFRGGAKRRAWNPELRVGELAVLRLSLANERNGTLYVGVTRDLIRRVYQHKAKATRGFTSKYGVQRVVWFETYDDPTSAITREKDIKK